MLQLWLSQQNRMLRFELGARDLAFFVGAYCATAIGVQSFALDALSVTLGWISAIAARASHAALNDAIQAERDRPDPTSGQRPVAGNPVSARAAIFWWALLSCIAIASACEVTPLFAAVALPAWFIGSAHAASPVKAHDIEALRVVVPTLRYPLHLALGWCAIGSMQVPPLLLLLGAWMLGAFVRSSGQLGQVRSAHLRGARVDERSRIATGILCSIGYGLGGVLSAGIIATALRVELVLAVPFALGLAGYYLTLAQRKGSRGIAFSSLRREPIFLALAATFLAVVLNSSLSNIPGLHEWIDIATLAR
ncbi:MAG: hypothetical protein IPN34_09620 [Planctomycetes bacterium]|nr:hypothetical protein [Planctomycetota bacterium]